MDSIPPETTFDSSQPSDPWRRWVIRKEIWLFLLVTFAFSWAIYGCLSLVRFENQTILSRWLLVAAYAPSLAAILLAAVRDPEAVRQSKHRFPLAFAVAFVGAASVEWLDHLWWKHRIEPGLILADLVLVSLAALVLSGTRFPRKGVRDLLSGLTRWRLNAGWYMLALFLWPATVLAGNALATAFGLGVPNKPAYPAIPLVPLAVESFFWYLLFGGPLNEEAGWRGFAQTKLQHRFSPLMAAVIVGAAWGLWHLPLHLMGMYPMGAVGAVIRVFSIPLAVVFAWLFNRTGQSLLPVLCLHASRNTTSLFLPRNYLVSELLFLLVAVVLVFVDRMWRPLKRQPVQACIEAGPVEAHKPA